MDCFIRDNIELAEGHHEKLLEIGDRSNAGVRMIRVGRVAKSREVVPHQIDEHAVIGHLEELFAIDLENGW
jgi:hypothetical protein